MSPLVELDRGVTISLVPPHRLAQLKEKNEMKEKRQQEVDRVAAKFQAAKKEQVWEVRRN